MLFNHEETSNEAQSPMSWPSKAVNAVLNLILRAGEDFDIENEEENSPALTYSQLQEEVDDLKQKNSELNQKLAEQVSLNETNSVAAQESIQKLQDALSRKENEKEYLITFQNELNRKIKSTEEKLRVSHAMYVRLIYENKNLKNLLKSNEKENKLKIAELTQANQELTSERDHLINVIQNHIENLAELKRSNRLDDQSKSNESEGWEQDLSVYLTDFVASLDEKIKAEFARCREENGRLHRAIQNLASQFKHDKQYSDFQRNALKKENEQLSHALEEAYGRYNNLNSSYGKVLEELLEVREEMEKERSTRKNCVMEYSKLLTSNEELKKKAAQLEVMLEGFDIIQ